MFNINKPPHVVLYAALMGTSNPSDGAIKANFGSEYRSWRLWATSVILFLGKTVILSYQ